MKNSRKDRHHSQTPKPSVKPVQTVTNYKNYPPFFVMNTYQPLYNTQNVLYDTLREAVPVIDSAIGKLVRLLGNFAVKCQDKSAEYHLQQFLDNVHTNGNNTGFNCFLSAYFDRLLTYGTSVAEIVPYQNYGNIYGIDNADNNCIVLRPKKENPMEPGYENRRGCDMITGRETADANRPIRARPGWRKQERRFADR